MTHRTGACLTLALAALTSACASAPVVPPRQPEPPSVEQKLSWILRFEDQRLLRDPASEIPPPVAPPLPKQNAPVAATLPPPPPDLVRLLGDREARIRRRAALAVGRVGLSEGTKPLVALLTDPEPEVRQMAAFALGLMGDPSARDALIGALGSSESMLVRGGAAEALGLIGDVTAADPIARLALEIVQSGALAQLPSEQAEVERDSPASAFRLAVYALARLNAYAALASAVLDESGRPRVRWWPVAYALQRLENPKTQPALRALVSETQTYTRAFAVKGLGVTKDRSAVPLLMPFVTSGDRLVALEAIRALGRIGDPAATPALLALLLARGSSPSLRLESVSAIASLGGEGASDALIDLLGDPSPTFRAAALQGLARLDPQGFVFILSGLDPDPHWSVRAALAAALGSLPPETGLPRLRVMLNDSDQRVIAAVLPVIAALGPPDASEIMLARLKAEDPVVRAAAARALAQLRPTQGVTALAEAHRLAQRDQTYVARAAALVALAAYGTKDATLVLNEALADTDWAVRVQAAALLQKIDPASDASTRIRPAPSQATPDQYLTPHLLNPTVSTQLLLETDRGTVQIELAVLDAPQTIENIATLARKGFYDGLTFHRVVPGFVVQTGDPRGDGEGGPGYTIRDELNDRSYVRGTVGMALDWEDTGGSQFFIAQSPQPHLDARYTVIGRVIAGMEIVDQIEQWDVLRRVRVWDGVTFAQTP